MITLLEIDAVASFKKSTKLATDKRINLIYGLNGTGKSTISNFLYKQNDPKYSQCRKTPDQTAPVLVYNQDFVQDSFYVSDSLMGIFSLSKENKAAEQKIVEATKKQLDLENELGTWRTEKERVTRVFADQKQHAIDEVWKIKTSFTGGDRVLEYCLDGLKGTKEKLFSHVQSVAKLTSQPKRIISDLRADAEALKDDSAQLQQKLVPLTFSASNVEAEAIFGTAILGNSDSEVAALIEKLGNSDWVKQGLSYIPNVSDEKEAACPFCQQRTITSKFLVVIKQYFDDTYQKQIGTLDSLLATYTAAVDQVPAIPAYVDHPLAKLHADSLSLKHQNLLRLLNANVTSIRQKIRSPKETLPLSASADALADFNAEIAAINAEIDAYNDRLKNRDTALASLKDEFWSLMRWQYDQTMARFETDRLAVSQKLAEIDAEIVTINTGLADARKQITLAQKETVNVDAAVNAINAGLTDLGISDFRVAKHSETLYRVVRAEDSADAFHTLSEGERMMISFLYFCELCKGKTSAEDTHPKRIVVIDDPISSLSHIYVYNVGQLIRTVFVQDNRFSQIFLLTHSLYFFYELTDTNKERRHANQKLFRLTKSDSGSDIQEMSYEEIQNDYQAYWAVINDPAQPPALIANCMRNIVEYFFNFVRKKDFNNVFQMPELQENKFQAFCRYINRESHSLGQNIIDMKEFNYDVFKAGLRLVFEKTGYGDHFKEMAKI